MEAREMMEQAGSKTAHDNSYVNQCVAKWAPLLESTGKMDPINVPRVKRDTAVLLENQRQYIAGKLEEDTLSGNAGYFTKYVLPVLRRVWPNQIANQLVSVQPMTAPVGGVFYFERKFGNRKGTKNTQGGIGNVPTDMAYDGELNAGDNMQQDFARYYSSEFNDYDVTCTDTVLLQLP